MSETTYKQYFLGSLGEEPAAELEMRVLDDPDFAAELSSAEERLVEDYLDGKLSLAEAGLFKANYLNTEERIKNVEMTRLMLAYARENEAHGVASDGQVADKRPGIIGWFNSISWGARLATASILLAGLIAAFWLMSSPRGDNELLAVQTRYEQLNQDPNSIVLDARTSEIALVSGDALRGAAPPPSLSHAGLTENVRFRIAMPASTRSSTARYDVAIMRGAGEVFRLRNISPIVDASGAELRLLLPREVLTTGKYRLSVEMNNTAVLSYDFVIK